MLPVINYVKTAQTVNWSGIQKIGQHFQSNPTHNRSSAAFASLITPNHSTRLVYRNKKAEKIGGHSVSIPVKRTIHI